VTAPNQIPGLTTANFAGTLAPPDVRARIINLLIGGAPFAASLTRDPTTRGSVAYPTASPSGWAWLKQLEQFPQIDVGDDAAVFAVAKLGGLVDLANELLRDSTTNITGTMSTVLRDSLSRDLDLGLLYGTGDPQPIGVTTTAPEATGANLLAAVAAAKGSIADAGGTPDTLAMSGAAFSTADTDTGNDGQLKFAGGFAQALGLRPVTVPELSVPLVYDSTRCFLVVNSDAEVAISDQFHFDYDATTVRIRARIAVAVPDPSKGMRKLTVEDAGTVEPASASSSKTSSKSSAA
jgi:hypothetical protein